MTATACAPAMRSTLVSPVRSLERASRGGTERCRIASARSRPSAGTVKRTRGPWRVAHPSTTIIPLGVSRAPYTNAPSPGFSMSLVSRPWKQVTAPGPVSATTPASARASTAPVRSAATVAAVTRPASSRATALVSVVTVGPLTSISRIIPGRAIRFIQQLHRVPRYRRDSRRRETRAQLHQASRVARGDDLRRGLLQGGELRREHGAGHGGLEQREQPRTAAALGGVGCGDELQHGDGAEQALGRLGDALRV